MNISRKEKEELDKLSQEVFGSSSRWQKLLNKGYTQPEFEEKEVSETKEDGTAVTKTVTVEKRNTSGTIVYINKTHTLESVRQLLLNLKSMLDERIKEAKKKKEAEDAKKQLEDSLSGSALNNA